MTRTRRTRHALAALATVVAAAMTGCAMPAGPLVIEKPESSALAPAMTAQAARDAVVVGQSTKAQVAAALGPATIVRFDGGREVWVYRTREAGGAAAGPAEFVILFAPDGIAQKTRVAPLRQH